VQICTGKRFPLAPGMTVAWITGNGSAGVVSVFRDRLHGGYDVLFESTDCSGPAFMLPSDGSALMAWVSTNAADGSIYVADREAPEVLAVVRSVWHLIEGSSVCTSLATAPPALFAPARVIGNTHSFAPPFRIVPPQN